MRISVIGLGYLGATHAVAMAKLGHQVVGVEPDSKKLASLKAGNLPFYEPGLDEALQQELSSGRLTLVSSPGPEIAACDIHFICVGTPQLAGSDEADLTYVMAAGTELASHLGPDSVVVGKSTVPVGTAAKLRTTMSEVAGFDVRLAWNPEFLREGTALEDSLAPDRIVIGVWSEDDAKEVRSVYQPLLDNGVPCLVMDVATSELVKVAANSFLATKISFINAMAEVAEASGADTVRLAEAIGMDDRIGSKFLRNGLGFGGGCLPKDIRGFMARARELGVGESIEFLRQVDQVNLRRRDRVVELAETELGSVEHKTVLVLGISFKPDSDDLRDSPALDVAKRLAALGAQVRVHDPKALGALGDRHPDLLSANSVDSGMEAADLVILGTEWAEYRAIDPTAAGKLVGNKLIIDARNVLDVKAWKAAGWKLIALGRNVHK